MAFWWNKKKKKLTKVQRAASQASYVPAESYDDDSDVGQFAPPLIFMTDQFNTVLNEAPVVSEDTGYTAPDTTTVDCGDTGYTAPETSYTSSDTGYTAPDTSCAPSSDSGSSYDSGSSSSYDSGSSSFDSGSS